MINPMTTISLSEIVTRQLKRLESKHKIHLDNEDKIIQNDQPIGFMQQDRQCLHNDTCQSETLSNVPIKILERSSSYTPSDIIYNPTDKDNDKIKQSLFDIHTLRKGSLTKQTDNTHSIPLPAETLYHDVSTKECKHDRILAYHDVCAPHSNSDLFISWSVHDTCHIITDSFLIKNEDNVNMKDSGIYHVEMIGHIPHTIRCLNLSHNFLKTIPLHYFEAFDHLVYLDLSFNQLTSLSFNLPPNLISLGLENNRLIHLHSLYHLKHLSWLNLNDNLSLSYDAIQLLVKQLQSLKTLWIHTKPTVTQMENHPIMTSILIDGELYEKKDLLNDRTLMNKAICNSKNKCQSNLIVPYIQPTESNQTSPPTLAQQISFADAYGQTELTTTDIDRFVIRGETLEGELERKNEILQASLEASDRLVSQIRQLDSNLDNQKSETAKCRLELSTLQHKNERCSSQLLVWQQKAADSAAMIISLQDDNTKLRDLSFDSQTRYTEEITNLKNEIETVQEQSRRELTEELQRYREDMTKLTLEKDTAKKVASQVEMTLKKEIQQAQQATRNANLQVWDLEAIKQELTQKVDAYTLQEVTYKEDTKHLMTQINEMKNKIILLETDKKTAIDETYHLKTHLTTLQSELTSCKEQLTELSVHWVPRKELNLKISTIEEITAETVAQKERLLKVTERNAMMRLELEQLKGSFLATEKLSTETSLQLQLKTKQLQDANNQLDKLKGSIMTKTKDLEESVKRLKTAKNSAEEKCAFAEKQLETFKRNTDVEALTNSLAAEKKMRGNLEKKLELLENEKKEKEVNFLFLQDAVDTLQQDLEAQKKKIQKDLEENERRRNQEDAEIRETLQNELKNVSSQLETLSKRNSELEKALIAAEELLKQRDEEMRVILSEMEKIETLHHEKLRRMEDFFKSMASS